MGRVCPGAAGKSLPVSGPGASLPRRPQAPPDSFEGPHLPSARCAAQKLCRDTRELESGRRTEAVCTVSCTQASPAPGEIPDSDGLPATSTSCQEAGLVFGIRAQLLFVRHVVSPHFLGPDFLPHLPRRDKGYCLFSRKAGVPGHFLYSLLGNTDGFCETPKAGEILRSKARETCSRETDSWPQKLGWYREARSGAPPQRADTEKEGHFRTGRL